MEKLFGPDHFDGLHATWLAIVDPMRVDPTRWVRQADVTTHAVEAGRHPKTVSKLISDAVQHERLYRRGEYGGRRGGRLQPDTRELRLTPATIARLEW